MAEYDGVSFGDFTFAFPTNPSFHFHEPTSLFNGPNSKINTVAVAKPMEEQESDDEWGDFVKSPLGSVASANAPSEPFDPFNFYSSNPASPSQSPSESGSTAGTVSGPSGVASVKGATQWVKLKGAIPLSIFGDVEEEEKEEEVERSGGVDPHDRSGKENNSASAVNCGSKNNAHLGVGASSSDVIASLYRYNHQMNFKTGMEFNINGSNLDTNGAGSTKKESVLELKGVNLDINSIAEKRDLDAVTELKDQGHKVHMENGFLPSTKRKNSNLDVLNANFTDGVISSSNFRRTNGKFGIRGGGGQNENDVWEFKDAYSDPKVSNGNEKVQSEMHKVSEANTYSREPKMGSDGSNDLFAISNSSLYLFSTSNGISSSSSDVAAGLNARSDAATQIGFASETNLIDEQTKAKSGLGDITVAIVEPDDDFGGFATAFAGAGPMQETHRISDSNTHSREPKIDLNGPINLFAMSNGSFDLFSMSSGISSDSHDIAVGWDDKPNAAAQNGFGSGSNLLCEQRNAKSGLESDTAVASAESDDDFGEFASAFAEAGTTQEEDLKSSDISGLELEKTFSDGKLQAESRVQSAHMNVPLSKIVSSSNRAIDLFSMSNGPIDLFAQVNGMPIESDKVDQRFNLNPSAAPRNEIAHNDYSFQTSSRSDQADCQDALDALQVAGDDEEFGEFSAAFEEEAQKLEGAETSTNNQKGLLPLSIFGEEVLEIDDSLNIRGAFPHLPGSSKKNDSSPNSTMSINNLISNLYSQAEQISAVESTEKLAQNGSTLSNSSIDSHTANDSDDFDNSSWEFKDAFSEKGTSLLINGDSRQSCSTKLKLNNYMDFYSKLKDELCLLVTCHLESLKEAQSAGISDEDANLATLLEEIQEAYMESGQKNSIAQEDISRHHLQRDADLSEFFQVLQEPKFHVLDSEYSIQRKLSLAQSDFRSAIELIIHVKTMLKILSLGSSEEQSTYVSLWSKMIYTCAQELQHGAHLWRDLSEKNVQSQILADPQGKRFVLAIGEIYRVALVLGASAKLYKPWTLSSLVESSSIPTLVDKCHALWRSSGLEEALLSIPGPKTSEGNYSLALLDSIQYTRDLDTVALQSNVFDQQEPVCRLSLLNSRVAPGMAMVVWGDFQCFVKLANLWANLISTDCPKLPTLHVS